MSLKTKRRQLLKSVRQIMEDSSGNESETDSSLDENSITVEQNVMEFHNEDDDEINFALDDNPIGYLYRSSSSECLSNDDEINLQDQLRELFLQYPSVPLTFVKSLLIILRKLHPLLPRDPRVIMGTQTRSADLMRIEPGRYYHIGIRLGILSIMEKTRLDQHTLTLQFNIDGLPPFRSNVKCFWPILCCIKEIPSSVYIIGIYFGERKPDSSNDYLLSFITELKEIIRDGIIINNETFHISIDGFCCDTPARSFMKCIKSHSGYYGCDRCEQRGVHINSRMTFPESDANRRTNISFRTRHQEEHHHCTSIIEEIPLIDMVEMFPNDYMHSVCKGIVITLLEFLRSGPLPYRLSSRQIEEMSLNLLSLGPYIPSDFARRPRSLRHLSMWKATEARLFCLYLAPVVLKPFVKENFYILFMTFTLLLRIISHPTLVHVYHDYCNVLVRTFLTQFSEVFGTQYLTYNIHSLVHLVEDCKDRGVVDNFSCFRYESFLFRLKRFIRSANLPLQQIINRISEIGPTLSVIKTDSSEMCKYEKELDPHESYHLFQDKTVKYFLKLTLGNIILKADSSDSYVLIKDNHVLRIMYFIKTESECLVIGNEYGTSEFNDFPLMSLTDTRLVSMLLKKSAVFTLSDVVCKVLCIPKGKRYVVAPILHTFGLGLSQKS